jgi:hypothetical protein
VAVKAAATAMAGVIAGNFLSTLKDQNRGQRSGAPYFLAQPSASYRRFSISVDSVWR